MGAWKGNDLILGDLVGGADEPITLSPDERALHTYVVGTPGVGKTRFLESLIQQDITNWSDSRAGLLFVDPDGESFDRLMGWIDSRKFLLKRPILPIDFRRADDVVAYNPLRHREDIASDVVANNLALAIANVWGDASLDETPRFSRVARSFLHGLYLQGATLPQGAAFLDFAQKKIRQAMAERISEPSTRAFWNEVSRANERDFLTKLESTANRFAPLLENRTLRAMLGQSGQSLDLKTAISEGYIILACVSQQGGQLDEKSQQSFVALLLADLWQTIKQRGKATSRKPFYVYLDEFHEFISPTLSQALPRARGYGLHFTFAHQYPGQLPLAQPKAGERMLKEILGVVQTVVAFRQRDEAEIDRLTRHLFSATFDPMKIKHVIESTKAIGIEKIVLSSWGESESTAGDTEVSGGGEVLDVDGLPTGSSLFSSTSSPGTSYSRSRNEHEGFMTQYGKEVSSVQFSSIEEQVFAASVALRTAPNRHAVVKKPHDSIPVNLRTRTVGSAEYPQTLVERFCLESFRSWPFVLSRGEAERILEEQRAQTGIVEEGVEHEMPAPRVRSRVVQSPNADALDD